MTLNHSLKVMAAILLLASVVLAWWGWQNLDSSLLLLGSRLC